MQAIKKLTNKFILKKYFLIAFSGALLGIGVCFFLLYSELQDLAVYNIVDAFLAGICGILIAVIISKISFVLNKLLPWQTQTGNRLFVGFIVHFIISYFLVLGFFYVFKNSFFEIDNFFEEYKSISIKLAIILLILALVFEVIYFALYSYNSYSKVQIEIVKQERKQIELQLKTLKSQLNPHFLFNNLNTISSLVYKDENRAEIFIRRFAKMYDFTLKSYHQKLITINEELDFVDSYNYLLQTRFQNKFTCSIDISDDLLATKVPPLTIQMLVENAVKHNQLSIKKPLKIKISSTATAIIIENNITETPKNVTSFNIGLKNINTRYLLLVNMAISVIRTNSFMVKLPIIR
jgi:two-component system LytT family sensor kinase